MSAISNFDTLATAKELEKAGVPVGQAEAITRVISAALSINLAELATKADIAVLRADIELLRRDMTIRLGGMMIVAVGVILAGVKYIH